MASSPASRSRMEGAAQPSMYEYPMTRLGSLPSIPPPRAHVNADSAHLGPIATDFGTSRATLGGVLPHSPQGIPAGIIRTPNVSATPMRAPPLFAEQFTPSSALRPGRRDGRVSTERNRAFYPEGRSQAGFYDQTDGDLFRGAESHPGPMDGMSRRPGRGEGGVEMGPPTDIASSTGTSSSSSSSGSSWSGLSLGRRMTHAMDLVGDALGVRRGSLGASTASLTDSSDGSASEATDQRRGRRRSKPKKSRTFSLGTRRSDSPDGSTATVKRQRIPTRREFCLVLPSDSPNVGLNDTGDIGLGFNALPAEAEDMRGRMTTSPDLAMILDMVKHERLRSGYQSRASWVDKEKEKDLEAEDWDSLPIVRKSHSDRGRSRRRPAFASRVPNDVSFANGNTKSKPKHRHGHRVQELRADAANQDRARLQPRRTGSADDIPSSHPQEVGAEIVRPKSASDLLGLQQSVRAARRQQTFILPPRPSLGRGLSATLNPVEEVESSRGIGRGEQKKACWWLDVSCPGWEDLRDLGELLHLHPLTLEDVLQQDPREKIDVFDQLGYYLIVFRAIDETYFKYTAPDSNPDLLRKQVLATERDKPPRKTNGFLGLGAGIGDFRKSKTSKSKLEIVEDHPGKEGLEGVGVGGINLYLVVFKDGVISFHYNDVSKHTDRVRERMLQFADQVTTSDWVAHGLMDSIVDAFFPLVNHIDDEVDEIDTLVIDPSRKPKAKDGANGNALDPSSLAALQSALVQSDSLHEKSSLNGYGDERRRGSPDDLLSEKHTRHRRWSTTPLAHPRPRLSLLRSARLRFRLWLLGWRIFLLSRFADFKARPGCRRFRTRWRVFSKFLGLHKNKHYTQLSASKPVYDRTVMLRRMMHIRRLTTGLSRLLGSKHQVVKRLKKRAADNGGEVWAYIGDVQDHIFMLETSLLHFEYILSHCQPAYMSHLNVSFSYARGNVDQMILVLSSVSIGVLPMQFLVGLFSMNIRIPANGSPHDRSYHKEPDGSQSPFNFFFSILGGAVLIGIGMVLLIRYWRWRAKIESKMGMRYQRKSGHGARGGGIGVGNDTVWARMKKKIQ